MTDRLTRRTLIRAGAVAAAVSAAPALRVRGGDEPAEGAPPDFTVDEVRTISHRDDVYHGWPTLTRRRNGQLLVVCSGGREAHICPFGRVEMMRSDDAGRSWTWPRTLIDSAIDDRDAGILETDRGALLVTTFTSLAYWDRRMAKAERDAAAGSDAAWPAEKLARWRAAHRRLSERQRRAELGTWMIRSTDGGVHFSARYRVPVNSPHGPIQLSDGRLLYAGKELWTEARRRGPHSRNTANGVPIGVAESADDGRSWRWLAEIPPREGDAGRDYHELHAVETPDGRIIAHIRNHNERHAGWTLQSESSDGGRSWSIPRPVTWGLPSHLLHLADGRLLMTYGHRREPFGIHARLSADGGRTWSPPMALYAEGTGGDLGYPSTVQLGGDDSGVRLLTVWYEKPADSPYAALRQAAWTLKA